MTLLSVPKGASEPDAVDFTISSSLPPMVAGALAGEMELSVPYLYPKPGVMCPTRYLRDRHAEPMFVVRMQWWGDGGPGTVFKPGLLLGRDGGGEKARRARLSKATCALFPVRCGLDGLLTYLEDMGSITLDVLVHEGEPRRTRHVGRCVVPVGGWGEHLDARPELRESSSSIVAEGYFPVASLDGNKYAGDLRVCLRARLGGSSKLRDVLAAAKVTVDQTTNFGRGEGNDIMVEALDNGKLLSAVDRRGAAAAAGGRHEKEHPGDERRSWQDPRWPGDAFAALPARASFDSADLMGGWSKGAGGLAAAATPARPPRDSTPLSSFQLNEALANFDASGTLPIWPTPKGSLYRPPEIRGEAPPTPRVDQRQARERIAAGVNAGVGRKASSVSKKVGGRVVREPPTRVGMALTGIASTSGNSGDAHRPGQYSGQATTKFLRSSVSPERQAPEPSRLNANLARLSQSGDRHQGRVEGFASPQSDPGSQRQEAAAAGSVPSSKTLGDGTRLSELLNRGKHLRDKMTLAAGPNGGERVSSSPSATVTSLPATASDFALFTAPPGLLSGAPLGSRLRDDIEGIFDTLSDGGPSDDDPSSSALVRDPETRGNEVRVVDLLLEAAGPPPASLAFPALAAVERQRADSLARVRFLRIRLSRLVMFGSMASAADGHGWQIRFRLPTFATPPGQNRAADAARHTNVIPAATRGVGGRTQNARVVSVPVPPRVSASTLRKPKAGVRRGRPASGATGNAVSILKVRRGFGASDLVVGETSLMEEVVCAVEVDDACVTQWMETAVEFLLIDGKTDGAPRPRPAAQLRNHPHLRKQQQRKDSSTVIPGDRVAAVAALPLRDLVLSADLGVATTLDLIEVSDFWAVEDARAAAAGRTGRGGRPLRNHYRSSDATRGGARPLVLGDRAVGALAVAMELVPGEQDVSPEDSRPEVERWPKSSRQQESASARRAGQGRGASEERVEGEPRVEEEVEEADVEEGNETAEGKGAGLLSPLALAGERTGLESPSGRSRRSGGAPTAGGGAETIRMEWKSGGGLEGPGKNDPSKEKHATSVSGSPAVLSTSRIPPSLEGSWKESSGALTVGPQDGDCAVVLRIDSLTLSPAASSGIERVRVAYSFTQVEGGTPTVLHRSVRGCRTPLPDGGAGRPRGRRFAFDHREVFPAPDDSNIWRAEKGASRVFEVWGCSAEEGEGGGEQERAGSLLGLAKVSLQPFAAFERSGEERALSVVGSAAPGAAVAAKGSNLAVGADGPVVVIDPFSGRAVGELHLFLALGSSSAIAALSAAPREGHPVDIAGGGVENERAGGSGAAGDDSGRSGCSAGGGGRFLGRVEKEEGVVDPEDRGDGTEMPKHGAEGGGGGGRGEELLPANSGPPALDDSAAELSMLLNPGRAESLARESLAEGKGCSRGSFTGLVRHILELSAVGELPLALDAQGFGEEDGIDDGPVGCAIEYKLPSAEANLDLDVDETRTPPVAGKSHELWWDADSGILNSRSRHTIKIPGGVLDSKFRSGAASSGNGEGGDGGGDVAATEGPHLNNLLDCMVGRDDVVLSLFWSSGGMGGEAERAPWSEGNGVGGYAETEAPPTCTEAAKRHVRSPMGKAVLRRSDLLPLVERTSSRAVLRLPIEPACAARDGKAQMPSVPEALPLSISYRREPSAVARRKNRGGSGSGHRGMNQAATSDSVWRDGLDESGEIDESSAQALVVDVAGQVAEGGLGKAGEMSVSGESKGWDEGREKESQTHRKRRSFPVVTPKEDSGAEDGTVGGESLDSLDRGAPARSSRTEHLLPARTVLCVGVKSLSLATEGAHPGSGRELLWVSFDFPRAGHMGRGAESKPGGVFVWEPETDPKPPGVHWSPATVANREHRSGRVTAGVQWSVELPVTIDAAFVEFMHTKSLDVGVWRGYRSDWPAGGTPCGVSKVVLRSLLADIGGVDGRVSIVRGAGGGDGDGDGGGGDVIGSMGVRLYFKHRGLGSNRDADAESNEGQLSSGATARTREGARAVQEDEELTPVAEAEEGDVYVEEEGRGAQRVSVTFPQDNQALDRGQSEGCREKGGIDGDPVPRNRGPATAKAAESVQGSSGPPADCERQQPEGGQNAARTPSSNSQRRSSNRSASSCGEEMRLRVHVERAMRLGEVTAGAAASRDRQGTADADSPQPWSLPTTYVTFRWEEGGKAPLRSPVLFTPVASTPPSEAASVAGSEEKCQGLLTADGEPMTPVVEQSSSPVFNHAADLRLVDQTAWARACGPSAALVFRVWRRACCSWWDDAPRTESAATAQEEPSPSTGVGGVAAVGGSRFGDKLIGSAVVGLEVLRGAVDAREESGLRDIDGWYHVLDDLQRPRGQIKVRITPRLPLSVLQPAVVTTPSGDMAHRQDVTPSALGSPQAAARTSNGIGGHGNMCIGGTDVSPAAPAAPLHDTKVHLRSVHALLDSLPAEFRSSQPRRLLPASPMRTDAALDLPSPSEEPLVAAAAATQSRIVPFLPACVSQQQKPSDTPSDRHRYEPSSMPELRRMLSSLDRVDQRLFALGGDPSWRAGGGDGDDDDDDDSSDAKANHNQAVCGPGGSRPVVGGGGGSTTIDGSMEANAAAAAAAAANPDVDVDAEAAASGRRHLAVFRLQRAWRARSTRKRIARALRKKRREEAALAIQVAYRCAQARHRAAATVKERRRREDLEQRRAVACAILQKAWRAFEARRRAAHELAAARARAAAAVATAAAARQAEKTVRGAVLVQAVWRGMSARAATARQIEASRARSRAAAAASVDPSGGDREPPPQAWSADCSRQQPATEVAPRPRLSPSTFYNQLSQDPRRSHRLQLPEAHLAASAAPSYSHGLPSSGHSLVFSQSAVPPVARKETELRADKRWSQERFQPRSLARSTSAVRPPRFADQETARIARIMKGNLQHWASMRSSSSGDD